MTLQMTSSAQIEIYRQKVRDGTITVEELRAAIVQLREGRLSAGASKSGGAKKASAKGGLLSQDETDNILGELGDL